MQKILILAANPKTTSRLRLDQELRDIEAGLRRAQHRDQFTLVQRLAVRPRDIQRAMLDETPQIVHFSGHGEGAEGLVFEEDAGPAQRISGEALAKLFSLFADPAEPNPIHCVVLNGCYSVVQAEAIAEQVPYVVGMTQAIGDQAAIDFAVGFYDALGAGRSVEFAYKLGCATIDLAGKPESATPVPINKKAPPSPPPSPSPSPSMPIPQGRSELYQFLLKLPDAQFNQVLFDLNPPPGNISPAQAPRGQRVPELFTWLESIGPGLDALRSSLETSVDTRTGTNPINPLRPLHLWENFINFQPSQSFALKLAAICILGAVTVLGLDQVKAVNELNQLFSEGNYKECVNKSKELISRNTLNSGRLEHVSDRCQIGLARNLADEQRYEEAIEVLHEISRDSKLYEKSQEFIEIYFRFLNDTLSDIKAF